MAVKSPYAYIVQMNIDGEIKYLYSKRYAVYHYTILHFNDHQFGYTVLEYYNKARVYNPEFAVWMRNVNNVFESVRRQKLQNIPAGIVRI